MTINQLIDHLVNKFNLDKTMGGRIAFTLLDKFSEEEINYNRDTCTYNKDDALLNTEICEMHNKFDISDALDDWFYGECDELAMMDEFDETFAFCNYIIGHFTILFCEERDRNEKYL
jgi:hypothetical protein